jgi:hypothetical protein
MLLMLRDPSTKSSLVVGHDGWWVATWTERGLAERVTASTLEELVVILERYIATIGEPVARAKARRAK